jgi:hypothetical protein
VTGNSYLLWPRSCNFSDYPGSDSATGNRTLRAQVRINCTVAHLSVFVFILTHNCLERDVVHGHQLSGLILTLQIKATYHEKYNT